MPIAHAEGRFLSASPEVIETLEKERLVKLVYCDLAGSITSEYPWNPNGSVLSAAAISNRKGNVTAMMPHPERAAWLKQVPDSVHGEWGRKKTESRGMFEQMEGPGPGRKFFDSLRRFLD